MDAFVERATDHHAMVDWEIALRLRGTIRKQRADFGIALKRNGAAIHQ